MKLFCVNLYKGLRIGNSGEMQFCCKSEEHLTNKRGEIALPWKDDLLDVMNGTKAVEIREALEKGIQHPNCKKCWDEEAGNYKSKRQHDSDRCDEYWGKEYNFNRDIIPEIVEFNLGTICNLKCRICGPWSSSFWQKEYKDLVVIPGTDKNAQHLNAEERIEDFKSNVKYWGGQWDKDSPAWDNIEKHISKMKKIDIFGGEPFLVENQWMLLKKCVENGWSKNQSLHFNTNGTQYKEEYVNLLPKFERAWISFSIDGIGQQFEYQRNPAKWDEVLSNIEKFKLLRAENPNIILNVCITVNIQNVYYIPETIQYFKSIGIATHLNMCHWPLHYNIKHIPENVKDEIIKKYKLFECDEEVTRHTKEISGMLKSQICNHEHWGEFLHTVQETDKYRQESFKDTFSEFAHIIGCV